MPVTTPDARPGFLRRLATTALAVMLVTPVSGAAAGESDYEQVLDIAFPTIAGARYSNDYAGARGGGTRVHKSTDVIAPKHSPAYAVTDGTICYINGIDGPMPSWGYSLSVCDDDGHRFAYLHINNDNPGTDDGQGGVEHAYAPGIRKGVRVVRGQLIGWVGDSGNAENTTDHIHFEIHDDRVTDPYGDNRINPYFSLNAARERGDYPDGTNLPEAPSRRVAGQDRIETAIELSASGFDAATWAVLAPKTTPGEAIVAGPLADHLDAPVLTTRTDALDERVALELRRLGVTDVLLIGAAFTPQVTEDLIALGMAADSVELIAGTDVVETSVLVAERLWSLQGHVDGVDAEVFEIERDTPALAVTERADRTDQRLLDGARISGEVRVSLMAVDTAATVTSVSFRIDDATSSGPAVHTEVFAPYDLLGTSGGNVDAPLALDTFSLGIGEHTVTATIEFASDAPLTTSATFFVGRPASDRAALVAKGSDPDASRSWPDSLMASYHGSALDVPVLLVAHDTIAVSVRDALGGASSATIIGGTAAIGEAHEVAISARVGTVSRLAGADRYATALAVVDDLDGRGLLTGSSVWVATGRNWPDAATAGAVVARSGDRLVLVNGSGSSESVTQPWLRSNAERIENLRTIGGAAAIVDDVHTRVARAIL